MEYRLHILDRGMSAVQAFKLSDAELFQRSRAKRREPVPLAKNVTESKPLKSTPSAEIREPKMT